MLTATAWLISKRPTSLRFQVLVSNIHATTKWHGYTMGGAKDHSRSQVGTVPLSHLRAHNEAQTGSDHVTDDAIVRGRVRRCTKTTRLSNLPTKLDMATFNTTALKNFRLELGERFEEGVSPEDEW